MAMELVSALMCSSLSRITFSLTLRSTMDCLILSFRESMSTSRTGRQGHLTESLPAPPPRCGMPSAPPRPQWPGR
eukprot:13314907-Heterocapsa_arctica.AAC.1